MQAKTGRADFDLGQRVGRGIGQTLDQAHGHGKLDAGAEPDDDARRTTIIAGGNRVTSLSERRACSIVNADRTMIRYRSRRPADTELRGRLRVGRKLTRAEMNER